MRKLLPLLLFALVQLSFSAFAPLSPEYAKGLLDMEAIKVSAHDATSQAYPDADTVMLDDRIITQYTPEGTYLSWDDTCIKILTEKGRRDYMKLQLSFCDSYEKEEVVLLQVISPDGKINTLDAKTLSSVQTDTSQMGSNIYDPHHKVSTTRIPGVEVGSLVRYLIRRELFHTRVPKTFSDYQLFEYDCPVMRYSYEVHAPAELPLKNIALLSPVEDTVTYTETRAAGGIIHKWQARNVPQVIPEPKMPRFYTCVQRLLISTLSSWEDVSRWYWNLCAPHLKPTAEIQAKVAELVKGASDEEARIRAIFRFVSQEIRYMGETTETEAPGYEPHDVSATFTKRHGVCRDKAALLAAMLHCAGFQAFPVLIHAGPLKDPQVPQPYFNHAITAIQTAKNEFRLMDSTDEQTADLFPAYLNHKSYLVATPDGTTLRTSPVPPADENLMELHTNCAIDAKGDLDGFCKLAFHALNDNQYRGFLADANPVEIRTFFQTVLKRVLPGASLGRLSITPQDPMDTETPLSMEFTFSAPSVMAKGNGIAFFRYPLLSRRFGIANFILGKNSLDKRRFPFVNNYTCAVEEHMEIFVDPAWGAFVPAPADGTATETAGNNSLQWTFGVTHEDNGKSSNTIFVHNRLAINTVEFSPEEYLKLKEVQKAIEAKHRNALAVFRPEEPRQTTPDKPDTYVLESQVDYNLLASGRWSETFRVKFAILTYHGKKTSSEVNISYHPDFEDTHFDFARVTNGENTTELNLKEIKIMDASGNASAPRYPQTKLLVANLPAVEVGSIIEYQFTKSYAGDQPFNLLCSFQDFYTCKNQTVTVTHPIDLPLTASLAQNGFLLPDKDIANIECTQAEENGSVRLTWSCHDMQSLPKEANLPRRRLFTPTLHLTTTNWKAWAKTIRNALETRAVPTGKIDELASQMQDLTEEEKIRAIRNLVAINVRTAGPAFTTIPLTELTSPERTLKDAYGNSADKAILIYTLLLATGFKPEFYLAGPSPLSEAEAPVFLSQFDPDAFPNVLVRVKADGRVFWLNQGDQYAELETCSYENCPVFRMDGTFIRLEVPRNFRSHTDTEKEIILHPDGGALITTTVRKYGCDFNSSKRLFKEQTPEQRRRYLLAKLAEISLAATADGELITDFDNYPGTITYTALVPHYSAIVQDCLFATVPQGCGAALPATSDSRHLPLASNAYNNNCYSLKISFPENFKKILHAPKDLKLRQPDGHTWLTAAVSEASDHIAFTYKFSQRPHIVWPEQYAALLEARRLLDHPEATRLILQNPDYLLANPAP